MIAPALSGYEEIDEIESAPHLILFKDISDHWGFKYIVLCQRNGLIDGFEDDTFRPEDNLTYAQTFKMCLSAIGYSGLAEDTYIWHTKWENMALEYGLIDSEPANPDWRITRIEAAQLIYKTLHMPICRTTGYEQVETEAGPVWRPTFEIMDGTNGSFESIYTTRFAKTDK